MIYILLLLVIQIIIIYVLCKKSVHLYDKLEDTMLDLKISHSKLEQLYRNYEVLNSKLQDGIKRIK